MTVSSNLSYYGPSAPGTATVADGSQKGSQKAADGQLPAQRSQQQQQQRQEQMRQAQVAAATGLGGRLDIRG